MKKILSILLVLAMTLSFCSFGVFAEEVIEETTEEVVEEEATEEVVEETPVNVAKIGDVEFETIADAVDEAEANNTIKLISNVELDESLEIPAGKDVVLDLCGYTVSMEDASSAAACAIKNNGTLTIKDSSRGEKGKITFVSTTPSGSYSYSTSAVVNTGSLTVESGTIENTTVGGASYAIDTAWYTNDTSITIKGGTITSKRTSVRQVPFSATAKNELTISGGTIIGEFAGVQTHNITSAEYIAEVNITGGTISGSYAYYTSYSSATGHIGTDIDIAGGTFNGYVFIYNGKAGSSDVDFANVSISKGFFNGDVYIYTKDSESNEKNIAAITGGDFTVDPSVNIAKGYARCASEVEGYVYSVTELKNDDVQVAPVVPSVDVSEDLDEGIKTEMESHPGQADISGIDDVVNEVADKVTDAAIEDAKTELGEITEVTEETPVNIFVQPSLDVVITEVTADGITLDITAMAQAYATTAEVAGDMTVGENAVELGEAKELDTKGQEVIITIPVPESIIENASVDGEDKYLMVKHIKDEDNVYYYPATVNEDNTITFTNPHGFSEFVVSAVDESTLTMEFSYNDKPVKDTEGDVIDDAEYTLYNIGAEIELPTAKKSGYTFKGWKFGRDNDTYKDTVVLTQEIWDLADEGVLKVTAVFKKNADKNTGLGGAGGGGDVVTSYTVSFDTNGGSQIESIKVFKGNKVSVPMAPVKDGETFEGWYTDKECTKKYEFSSNVYSSFTLYAKWIGESETIFADVTAEDWFYDVVNDAYVKGLMNGMDEENFGPQLEINRAMFVTVLHRIDGNTEAKAAITFTDVPIGAYYEKAVAWAVSSGIVEGYGDGLFGSTDPITREQMAVMLYRFAQYKGVDISGEGETFSDADSIADWAKAAVEWATGAGVLNGMGDGTYAPKATATRAQGAAVFVRIDALVK